MSTLNHSAPPVRLPVWLILLMTTMTGALLTLAYDAGGLVRGLEGLGAAIEKVDRRVEQHSTAIADHDRQLATITTACTRACGLRSLSR